MATFYEVIDTRTKRRVGKPYKDRGRAARRVDKLDNEYGAYRYFFRRTEIPTPSPKGWDSVEGGVVNT